jgi:alkylhydroperoxidase family enzyme
MTMKLDMQIMEVTQQLPRELQRVRAVANLHLTIYSRTIDPGTLELVRLRSAGINGCVY